MRSLCAALLVAILATTWAWERPSTFASVQGAARCLPDQQEFWGMDTKHPYRSYFALDFIHGKSAIKRQGIGKMVKDWSLTPALRYDINPAFCNVSQIDSERDLPQCVPATAVKEGDTWSFKNQYGATLYYQDSSPSKVIRKVSPDGKTTDTFSEWNETVSDDHAFLIPMRCVHYGSSH